MNPQNSLEHDSPSYIDGDTGLQKERKERPKECLDLLAAETEVAGDGRSKRRRHAHPETNAVARASIRLFSSYLCTHLTLIFQNNVGQENHKRKFQKVRKMVVSEKYKSLEVHYYCFMVFMKH
jgi:hypothetical protein